MGILKINYKAALNQGFQRVDSPDTVWFDDHGFEYFIMEKHISPNAVLYWDIKDHDIEICFTDKDGIVKDRRTVCSYAELESLILLGSYYSNNEE
jgi:hypothetical protein